MPYYIWDLKRGPNLENYLCEWSCWMALEIKALTLLCLVTQKVCARCREQAEEFKKKQKRALGFRVQGLGFSFEVQGLGRRV